jgi:transposase
VCSLNQDGEIVLHQHMQTRPETLLKAMAPYRDALVVAVDGLCTWSWLAALCAQAGLACVLGQARSLQALHGGQAKNDKIDAHQIAGLLRGGMVPQASVSPAAMRATRALRRRRLYRARTRAALLPHVQTTNRPYPLPAIEKKIADKANRDGGAERFPAPAVHKSIAGDLALMGDYEPLLRDVELAMGNAAQQPHAHALSLLPPGPGIGKILRLVFLYEMQDIQRFPSGQDCLAYCRLGKGAQASAGQRSGTSGAKSGNA